MKALAKACLAGLVGFGTPVWAQVTPAGQGVGPSNIDGAVEQKAPKRPDFSGDTTSSEHGGGSSAPPAGPAPAPAIGVKAEAPAPKLVGASSPEIAPLVATQPQPVLVDPAAGAGSFITTSAARPAVAAPSAPSPAATFGQFSYEAAANLVDQVCASTSDANIAAAALRLHLPAAEQTRSIAWALPADMKAWDVDTLDSDVFLYTYGAEQKSCGAVIARPLAEIVRQRLQAELQKAPHSYAVDSEQTLEANVKFVRFRSANGRFLDLMEYPTAGEEPGLIKLELLPP